VSAFVERESAGQAPENGFIMRNLSADNHEKAAEKFVKIFSEGWRADVKYVIIIS